MGVGERWGFEEKREAKPTCVTPVGFAYRLARELALPKVSAEGPALLVGDATSASKALHHTTSHRHMHELNIFCIHFRIEQLSSPIILVRTIPSGSSCATG